MDYQRLLRHVKSRFGMLQLLIYVWVRQHTKININKKNNIKILLNIHNSSAAAAQKLQIASNNADAA